MKYISRGVLILCAVAGLSACSRSVDVKIGLVAPMSGSLGQYGKDMEQGAQVALDELMSESFRIDGKKVNFILVTRDDKADRETGKKMAQELVNEGVVAVFGHFNSGVSIEAAPIYAKAGIPQLSPSTNPKYTRMGLKTTFRITADDIQQGASLGRLIAEKLRAKSVFMVDDKTLFGVGLAEEVKKKLDEAGIKPGYESVDGKNASYSYIDLVGKIKAANPDVVFFGGDEGVGLPLLKNMREQGVNALFVAGDAMCDASFIQNIDKVAKGAADQNFYCSIAGVPPSWLAAGISFTQLYNTKYKAQPGTYSTLAYTGMNVFAEAMQTARSTDPKVWLDTLAKGAFDGKIQGTVEFDQKGDVKDGTVVIFESIKGKLTEKRNLM
ncbi:branched-chain amino acid ABC transporter substrate-binding protein [Massilia sp. W12]|uniref:branched-chain amino acid ABC transporter substrate-binding protein n=1 Tax=Massilia sp. W12 TaxID=3126507 RepID=UPI0030CAD9FD